MLRWLLNKQAELQKIYRNIPITNDEKEKELKLINITQRDLLVEITFQQIKELQKDLS